MADNLSSPTVLDAARRVVEDAKIQCLLTLEDLSDPRDNESLDYVKEFVRDLDVALESLRDHNSYRTTGHAFLAAAATGHYKQRSCAGMERSSKYRKAGKRAQLQVVGEFFGVASETNMEL